MNVKEAYQYCQQMAKQHYENFPVASLMLPADVRKAVTVIYAFARTADDFADEGELTDDERLAALDDYQQKLEKVYAQQSVDDPVFIALADVIQNHQLPPQPFERLLSAFRQDVTKTRYADFGEVMDYCRRSANPVGELLLRLYKMATPRNIALSDGICSALQLINFLQDIEQDYVENQRIYLPQDEMERHQVSETHIRKQLSDAAIQQLLRQQIERARKILKAGAPLGRILPGRLGLEMRLIIYGGTRILYRLHQQSDNGFTRPRLRFSDKVWVVWRALFPR